LGVGGVAGLVRWLRLHVRLESELEVAIEGGVHQGIATLLSGLPGLSGL
jgi:hypothetical protein